MGDVVHSGLRISFEESGEGEPVVFLPGTATDSSLWLPSVATYLPDSRAIMVDPRDTPKSDAALSPYVPADLAQEALAVLDASEVEAAHVVGYSLGGAVAQELVLAAPERVRTLTLICTWPKSDAWLSNSFRWLAEGARRVSIEWANQAITWLVFTPEFQASEAYESALLFIGIWGQSAEALARQLDCDQAHDAKDRLASISCPTLVVGGASDIWILPNYSIELARLIPGAQLEIVEGVGHGIPIERAEYLFALIRKHIVAG